jgi:hypothetical protein
MVRLTWVRETMEHTDSEKPETKPIPQKKRWFRVPRFWMLAAISFVAFLAFVVWMRIDAQFPNTLYSAGIWVGFVDIPADPAFIEAGLWDKMWDSVNQWDSLGSRLVFFATLAGLAILGAVGSVLRLYFTGSQKRCSRMQFFAASFLVSIWVTLWLLYPRLEWWAIQKRVNAVLPRFETAAQSLKQKWPENKEVVPEFGKVLSVPDEYPNLLLRQNQFDGEARYPMNEGFGFGIEKSNEGIMRFELDGALNCRLEKHTRSSSPISHTNSFGIDRVLVKSVSLGNFWYLVMYR